MINQHSRNVGNFHKKVKYFGSILDIKDAALFKNEIFSTFFVANVFFNNSIDISLSMI